MTKFIQQSILAERFIDTKHISIYDGKEDYRKIRWVGNGIGDNSSNRSSAYQRRYRYLYEGLHDSPWMQKI